nr:MAG TPA: hypothetical protein [Caudoviricetes sp.]
MKQLDFTDFTKEISDLMPSNKGGKKESLYKKDALESFSGKSNKNKRDKLRKMLLSFCTSVVNNESNKENAKRVFSAFENFYKEVFVTNDYSFASVCSSQRKDSEKEIISKAMSIFAKFAKENKKAKK